MLTKCNGILSEHVCIRLKYIMLPKWIRIFSKHIPILSKSICILSMCIHILFTFVYFFKLASFFKFVYFSAFTYAFKFVYFFTFVYFYRFIYFFKLYTFFTFVYFFKFVYFYAFEYFFTFLYFLAIVITFLHLYKLLWLNPGAWEEHLTIQLLWATVRLVIRVRIIYLMDEFIFLFLVKLKETRTLGKSKVLSFFVSGVNQGDEKVDWVQDPLV